mmetsp:Transcript_11887/g.27959  ORF Transcript_11887/g.27959 Transcript_11887/m.27959 type:complete len:378 (-) Transcript_11887:8-1141(-)
MTILIDTVLDNLVNFEIDPDRFSLKHEEMARNYDNERLTDPYQFAMRQLDQTTNQISYSLEDQIQALKQTTADDVTAWIATLKGGGGGLVGLVHGNVDDKYATMVADQVQNKLKLGGATVKPLPVQAATNLSATTGSIVAQPHPNPDDPNTALELYYQLGGEGVDADQDARMILFSQMIHEPCFNTLRTQQQLGYIVACRRRRGSGQQGLDVIIQSSVQPAPELDRRARLFVNEFVANLSATPAAAFENHRNALLAELQEKPKRMSQVSSTVWGEISSGRNAFDRVEQLVTAVKKLKMKDIMSVGETVSDLHNSLAVWVLKGGDPVPQFDSDQTLQRQLVEDKAAFNRVWATPFCSRAVRLPTSIFTSILQVQYLLS